MANGWGGARPGAGPKPRPIRHSAAKKRPTPPAAPAAPKPLTGVMIRRALEASKLEKANRVTNPFKALGMDALHPPRAVPKKGSGDRIAMDEALGWAGERFGELIIAGAIDEGLAFLGYPYLSELAQRPEYRIITETIATEMTRKWGKFRAASDEEDKTDKIKELTDFMEGHLKVRDHFAHLAELDGYFGRGHLFLDFGIPIDSRASELATPIGNGRDALTKAKVAKGSLKGLRVLEPVWLSPITYNATNPLDPNWYNPQTWYCMGTAIDRSRLLTFVGHPVPDMLKPMYSFGGLSLTQMAKPYVDIWLNTRQSVADLIRSFSIMILSTDMGAALSGASGTEDLAARVQMFNAFRDNQGLFLLNKATEDFKNVSASLAGMHELQAQAQEHLTFPARIPVVKMFGTTPQGLNASSDGEIRAFYDTTAAFQNKLYRPNLNTLIDVCMLSLWGERDPEITFEFEPLWEMSAKEKSEMRKVETETDQVLVDTGVVTPAEVRGKLVNDPESPYHGLDPKDVPDLQKEEEEGLEPGGRHANGGGKGNGLAREDPKELDA